MPSLGLSSQTDDFVRRLRQSIIAEIEGETMQVVLQCERLRPSMRRNSSHRILRLSRSGLFDKSNCASRGKLESESRVLDPS